MTNTDRNIDKLDAATRKLTVWSCYNEMTDWCREGYAPTISTRTAAGRLLVAELKRDGLPVFQRN